MCVRVCELTVTHRIFLDQKLKMVTQEAKKQQQQRPCFSVRANMHIHTRDIIRLVAPPQTGYWS